MAILDRMANLADWQLFLKEYASAFGADEWPGNPGASESDLVKIEQRLKVTLPPSYRAFLKASNGWRKASDSVPVLRSVEKIKWFRKENREWVDAYVAPQQGMESPISDVDYFSYTAEGSAKFDGKHLAQTLCISDEGDSAVLLAKSHGRVKDYAETLRSASRFLKFNTDPVRDRSKNRDLQFV